MRAHINKILKELEHLTNGWEGTAVTRATDNLFRIDENATKLNLG